LGLGRRGLPGGESLARLLARHRGVRNRKALAALAVPQILGWADAFFANRGRWPNRADGPVHEAAEDTWSAVNAALFRGCRGLPGGLTLAGLLERHRGVRNRKHLPRLTERRIRAWARAHRARSGTWPTENSGAVVGTNGEVWANVNQALREGLRGLPGGDTLARLLARGGAPAIRRPRRG
jgi:hypothetical protein